MKRITFKYSVILIFIFIYLSGCAQVFKYKSVPKNYLKNKIILAADRGKTLKILKQPYLLINSLPKNYVKDGSKDYTLFLQQGIDKNGDIIFPDFPVLINKAGLTLKSNTQIYFPEKSKLVLLPNDEAGYEILRLHNVKNISLYYPNILGDKEKRISKKGEWGFGISIRGSRNIKIQSAKVSSCQGDGIYIGFLKVSSKDITIKNAFLDNNKRNGLSITSGINIYIDSGLFSNTNGQGPGSGIDVEPNSNNNEMTNVNITNSISFNNVNWGILINLVNFRKGEKLKNLNINVNNHLDNSSDYGMGLWITSKNRPGKGLVGQINITNPKWIDNRTEGFRYFVNDNNTVNVNFKNIKIYNKKNGTFDSNQIQEMKKKYANDANVHFKNL